VGSSSKGHRYEMRTRKHKLSIDLNQPAPEEGYEECRTETGDESKQKIKKLQTTIKKLKQERLALELWNAKLQEKVQKLKTKNKNQHEMSKKVRKMNIKLYWSNVVLKTKLKHRTIQRSVLCSTVKVSRL
jgi:hypothetical protein